MVTSGRGAKRTKKENIPNAKGETTKPSQIRAVCHGLEHDYE